MENLEIIRERLESHFSNICRRVWIQRSTRPSSRDIMVTLFPISISENYEIVSLRNLPEVSFEQILRELLKRM